MEDINKLYADGLTTRQIGAVVGKSHTWVRKHLDSKIEKKINSQDRLLIHNSFSDKNSASANYWAGFIASDGCISYDKGNGRIAVVSCDIDSLIKFKKYVNSSNKITKCGNCNRIEFTSQQMCEDLYKHWNLTEKKSLTLSPPNISDDMLSHYIRGVFDDDGSVSNNSKATKNKTSSPASYADISTASKVFADWLKSVIPNETHFQDCKPRALYKIRMQNYSDVLVFLKWIYDGIDVSLRMDRKYAVYENLLSYE